MQRILRIKQSRSISPASFGQFNEASEMLRCALHDGQASTVTYARVPKSQARVHHQILNYEVVQESFSTVMLRCALHDRLITSLITSISNAALRKTFFAKNRLASARRVNMSVCPNQLVLRTSRSSGRNVVER